MSDIIKELREIRNSIKGLQDSYILRQPTMLPKKEMYYYCFYGGSTLDRTVTLGAQELKRILLWEGAPAFLYLTLLAVTMPDATVPYVGYVMSPERGWNIADWTIEEYNTDLGLVPGRFIPSYGGCTKYDADAKYYVGVTMWEWPISDRLEVHLKNYTDVEVDVAIYDIQLYSYAHHTKQVPHIRETIFPWVG